MALRAPPCFVSAVTFYPILVAQNCHFWGGGVFYKNSGSGGGRGTLQEVRVGARQGVVCGGMTRIWLVSLGLFFEIFIISVLQHLYWQSVREKNA